MTANDYEMLLPWLNAGLNVVLDLEPAPVLLRKRMLDQVEGGYVLTKEAIMQKAVALSEQGYLGTRPLPPIDPSEGDSP